MQSTARPLLCTFTACVRNITCFPHAHFERKASEGGRSDQIKPVCRGTSEPKLVDAESAVCPKVSFFLPPTFFCLRCQVGGRRHPCRPRRNHLQQLPRRVRQLLPIVLTSRIRVPLFLSEIRRPSNDLFKSWLAD